MKFASKQIIVVFIVILVLVLGLHLGRVRFFAARPLQATLADGSRITIEAVTYGTNHTFVHGSKLLAKVQPFIPSFLERCLPSTLTITRPTSEETLIVWYSAYSCSRRRYIYPN